MPLAVFSLEGKRKQDREAGRERKGKVVGREKETVEEGGR